jgi:hypothetical protein
MSPIAPQTLLWISKHISRLVETKHLYQWLDIDEHSVGELTEIQNIEIKKTVVAQVLSIAEMGNWRLTNDDSEPTINLSAGNHTFPLMDAKLFCRHCKRIEPHAAAGNMDTFGPPESKVGNTPGQPTLDFRITYRCLSCRVTQSSFLVRKSGLRLTLCGRAPIETVLIGKDIPKNVSKYLVSALVAFNSGAVLAAIMYLRTLIEQWLKSLGMQNLRAEEALDWYMSTLPDYFRDQFPSLRDGYAKLSAALHNAEDDTTLFETWAANIDEHFEARRVNKIILPRYDIPL